MALIGSFYKIKKNSIEFLLGSVHYLYNYYIVYALLSHAYYMM